MAVIRKNLKFLLLFSIISYAHIGSVAAGPVAQKVKQSEADPNMLSQMFDPADASKDPPNSNKSEKPAPPPENKKDEGNPETVPTPDPLPKSASKQVPDNQGDSSKDEPAPGSNVTDTNSMSQKKKEPEGAATASEKVTAPKATTSTPSMTSLTSPALALNNADETHLAARDKLKLPPPDVKKNATEDLKEESKPNQTENEQSNASVDAKEPGDTKKLDDKASKQLAGSSMTADPIVLTGTSQPQLDTLEEAEESTSDYDPDGPAEEKGANEAAEPNAEKPTKNEKKPKEEVQEKKTKEVDEKAKKKPKEGLEEEEAKKPKEEVEEKPKEIKEDKASETDEKKSNSADEEISQQTPQPRKSKPVEAADDLTQSESSHFMFYLIVFSVLVVVAYLAVHNKKKIIGLIIEGRTAPSSGRRGSRGGARYRRLDKQVNEEDAMPLRGSDRHNVIY